MATYPGGKAGDGVYQTIINQLPPHDTYIEAFAGGAAIARHKRPAAETILIDRHRPALDALSPLAAQIGARIICGDALAWLAERRWTGRELVYLDPPYVRSARKSARDLYAFEMDDADHERLLDIATAIPCPVAISGYASDLYERRLTGWRQITFQARTRGGGSATEILWMNYPPPSALHDYTHLGADYQERERIKKKVRRWESRLAGLPHTERLALLSAMLQHPPPDILAEMASTASNDDAGRQAPPEMAV
jgi:site-specific DNA-adenine methylase